MNLDWIPLSDPDITSAELEAVKAVLESPQLAGGPLVEEFEEAFARYTDRRHAVGTMKDASINVGAGSAIY
jgi:dTDP-4-amino-4,6-dideoxygalactose transaminase